MHHPTENHHKEKYPMKDNRNITAKSNMTVDHYLDLVADAKAAGTSVSTLLRDSWLKCRNGKPASRASTRPSLGPFRAKFAPGRAQRGFAHMRS